MNTAFPFLTHFVFELVDEGASGIKYLMVIVIEILLMVLKTLEKHHDRRRSI